MASPLADRIFQLFEKRDYEAVERVLSTEEANDFEPNTYDSNGMSPLDHAAYGGREALVELLLAKGAKAHHAEHGQGYTPLMFAALSGNPSICRRLLDAGARLHSTNAIGKTAAEMAAFVGQHECVAALNSHVSRTDLQEFLAGEDSAHLAKDENFVALAHRLICSHEVHVILIFFQLKEKLDVWKENAKKLVYLIDRVFERQLRSKQNNDIMALKLWLILSSVREASKQISDGGDGLLSFCRQLLVLESGDQSPRRLDAWFRETLKAFPYQHLLVFQALAKTVSKTTIGQRPTAYDCILQALFGQRLVATAKPCSTCGKTDAKKKCSTCKAPYCSETCQKFDWRFHRVVCAEWAEVRKHHAAAAESQDEEVQAAEEGIADLQVEEDQAHDNDA